MPASPRRGVPARLWSVTTTPSVVRAHVNVPEGANGFCYTLSAPVKVSRKSWFDVISSCQRVGSRNRDVTMSGESLVKCGFRLDQFNRTEGEQETTPY
jgi:hypothetical protein